MGQPIIQQLQCWIENRQRQQPDRSNRQAHRCAPFGIPINIGTQYQPEDVVDYPPADWPEESRLAGRLGCRASRQHVFGDSVFFFDAQCIPTGVGDLIANQCCRRVRAKCGLRQEPENNRRKDRAQAASLSSVNSPAIGARFAARVRKTQEGRTHRTHVQVGLHAQRYGRPILPSGASQDAPNVDRSLQSLVGR